LSIEKFLNNKKTLDNITILLIIRSIKCIGEFLGYVPNGTRGVVYVVFYQYNIPTR